MWLRFIIVITVKWENVEKFRTPQVSKIDSVKAAKQPSGYRLSHTVIAIEGKNAVMLAQKEATQGATLAFISTPHTCRKYTALFYERFEWPYFRDRARTRQGALAINRTAVQIDGGYRTEAQSGLKHTTYEHNRQEKFNRIPIQSLSSRASPQKPSRKIKRRRFVRDHVYIFLTR